MTTLTNSIVTNNRRYGGPISELGFIVFEEAYNEDDFFNAIQKEKPKYVLLENHMGGMPKEGEIFVNKAARKINKLNSGIKVVVFSEELTGERLNPNQSYFHKILPKSDFRYGYQGIYREILKDFLNDS